MFTTVKDRELYEGYENCSHVALKPTIKKYRGRDTESMGRVMDSKYDKWRGVIIEKIWKESILHLNELPVRLFNNLGQQSMKTLFRDHSCIL